MCQKHFNSDEVFSCRYSSLFISRMDRHVYFDLCGKTVALGISLAPHYHFHPLHRRLDFSRAIVPGSLPLHIG